MFIDITKKKSIISDRRSKKVKVKLREVTYMKMSDKIEAFITELLKDDTGEWLEIGRNELASVFGCVPSQINYVIQTRFSPEQGYMVESRRGGGGCLKIKRIRYANGLLEKTASLTGSSLDEKTAKTYLVNLLKQEVIDEKTARIMISAISDSAIGIENPARDRIRAGILKNMLRNI